MGDGTHMSSQISMLTVRPGVVGENEDLAEGNPHVSPVNSSMPPIGT